MSAEEFNQQTNPEDLRNTVYQLQQKVIDLERAFLDFSNLDEATPQGGELAAARIGISTLDESGIHSDANVIDINWWLPLNLANDVLTYVYDFVYDGAEYVYVAGIIQRIGGKNGTTNYAVVRYSLLTRDWSVIGSAQNSINAIAYNSGTLYVGGLFTDIDGVANTTRIAKWNGTTWSALGTGANGEVSVLVVDGSGNLYAGGQFSLMGGVANTVYIAKWNGTTWSALGTGAASAGVYALAFDGSGNLFAGGSFSGMSAVANTAYIAKWNGSAWSSVGVFNDIVYALYYDSISTYIYAGGQFTTITSYTDVVRVARYDGTAWSGLGTGIDNGIVLCVIVDASGNPIVGGTFTNAGGEPLADRIAIFENGIWQGLSNGGGTSGLDGAVYALLVLSNGSIMAGGSFNFAGAIQCQSIAIFCKPLSEAIEIIASLFELYVPMVQTYTPTLNNTTNVAASTPYVTNYQQVGNVVHVFGECDVDPTTAGVATTLGMSLPIASNLANTFELAGTGVVSANFDAVRIVGDATNNRANLAWKPTDGTNRVLSFHFSYRIL